MPAYEIRAASPADEDQLYQVARHLNTVNLPDDREGVRSILDVAHRTFTHEIKDPKRREHVFVLVDKANDKIIGTSMIFGQLGRRDAPYIYLDVIDEERYEAQGTYIVGRVPAAIAPQLAPYRVRNDGQS